MKKTMLLLIFFTLAITSNADDLTAVVTPATTGASNGSIDLTVSGGIAPYEYSWKGPNGLDANTEDLSNLPAGTYTVTVTDKYCGIATLVVVVKSGTTGITTEEVSNTVFLAPNPSNDFFIIHAMQPFKNVSVRLFNLSGRIIEQQENLSGNDLRVDISSFSNGIYFVEIINGNNRFRKKMIKN